MRTVRFGMFSDLHMDIMHDGEWRLRTFLKTAREMDVDFIVHLGDFCYPEDTTHCECSEENMPVNLKNSMRVPIDVPKMEMLQEFNNFEKPSYHVLGNHEFDFSSKQQTMALYGIKSSYYSFECKDWRFIVLDASHYRDLDGKIKDYWYGDYFNSRDLPYIDEEQMRWLKDMLLNDPRPTIIFSHQPLNAGPRGLRNAEELRALIARANHPQQTVFLCANGHTHVDRLECVDDVFYYTLNSISNHWVGPPYECHRYSKDIDARFPNLKYVLPYEKPVFAIVELSDRGALVQGRQGTFVKPEPDAANFGPYVSPSVMDRELLWNVNP